MRGVGTISISNTIQCSMRSIFSSKEMIHKLLVKLFKSLLLSSKKPTTLNFGKKSFSLWNKLKIVRFIDFLILTVYSVKSKMSLSYMPHWSKSNSSNWFKIDCFGVNLRLKKKLCKLNWVLLLPNFCGTVTDRLHFPQ